MKPSKHPPSLILLNCIYFIAAGMLEENGELQPQHNCEDDELDTPSKYLNTLILLCCFQLFHCISN